MPKTHCGPLKRLRWMNTPIQPRVLRRRKSWSWAIKVLLLSRWHRVIRPVCDKTWGWNVDWSFEKNAFRPEKQFFQLKCGQKSLKISRAVSYFHQTDFIKQTLRFRLVLGSTEHFCNLAKVSYFWGWFS